MTAAMWESEFLIEREVKEKTPVGVGGGGGLRGSIAAQSPEVSSDIVLGVAEKDAHGVAFLVARKIAARGTLAIGMFHRTFSANQAKVEQIFAGARQRIAERLTASGA